MNGSRKIVLILILFTVILLALFYSDFIWSKPSAHIVRTSSYSNSSKTANILKPNIGPFRNDNPTPCSCQKTDPANKYVSKDELEEMQKRRAEEFRQHQIRTGRENDVLILAPANTPLQYPIKGFRVTPMNKTRIPGLALQAEARPVYKVTLRVQKGLLSVLDEQFGELVDGQNEKELSISSSSLKQLNELLSRLTYTSTVYHIKTQDLAYFSFDNHEVIFPIEIRRLSVPVLFDPGKDVNSQVTVLIKVFLRYKELNVLIQSIRSLYPKIKIIVADDSLEPEKVKGENIEHYIMPPAQGWFAGRNLALSQVTTKYFLWVDDDFVFLENTNIESFVKIMEANPELDVVGGQVESNQFSFRLEYEEGSSDEDGVVNYFMGRTEAVRKVGFDPFLKRVAHTEFFIDALGDLLVVTCKDLKIGHQKHSNTNKYSSYRHPSKSDSNAKMTHHFFKNHLKCIKY
ncbi:beta-1,4 N-acetylgalactosaminyltransferase 2 isoform X2 [Danio aesculapii]|uniref:beta-1,4 N-acetylgalactosaminyltransferase 2 isoform X2 n=1 Tax=Danio aesculapii TaxID=1142201 RepID=UPI0024BFE0D0|nr:beta-1,4 N-acetylgalactosaminyltransferase 2 isoform X2 [Danio aesculapii]